VSASIRSEIETAGVDDDDGFVWWNLFGALQIKRKAGDTGDIAADGAVKRACFGSERLALDGEKGCLRQFVADCEDVL